jgi:serine-type D-Ala-D-Ala endopeptidase (penicillin-binding protein 7)
MPRRALRLWGALLLCALTAPTTATVEAASRRGTTGQSSIHHTPAPRGKARRRGRRARRPPPPGGVYARNAVVLDPATGELLYEKDAGRTVPIASLSKLMTVLVFLEQDPDLSRMVEVTRAELSGAGRTQLLVRERVALGDLLHMSLMCSDNAATRVMVRESGLASEDFLARMNRRGVELGLARTRFVEFTGLDERNVASAADCARLLHAAARDHRIQDIMTKRTHYFRSATRYHSLVNTNRLLYGRYEIRAGKTGFIDEAGYCLATWIHTQGRDMIAVVLGAPTAATRFADVVRLVHRITSPTVSQTH